MASINTPTNPPDTYFQKEKTLIADIRNKVVSLSDEQKASVLADLKILVDQLSLESSHELIEKRDVAEMAGRPLSYLPPCPVCGKTDLLAIQIRYDITSKFTGQKRVITQCVCRRDACFKSNLSGGNRYVRPFVEGLDDIAPKGADGKINLQAEQQKLLKLKKEQGNGQFRIN